MKPNSKKDRSSSSSLSLQRNSIIKMSDKTITKERKRHSLFEDTKNQDHVHQSIALLVVVVRFVYALLMINYHH